MLKKKAIEPGALELLKLLMHDANAKQFSLAGGTSLALQLGHRRSGDLDFFTYTPFNFNTLFENLRNKGFNFSDEILDVDNNTLNTFINGVKVQFMSHQYNQVSPIKEVEGIRLYDLPDIAAMKLNAISNRGDKKYFWDYDELLLVYSLKIMLRFYEKNTI
jgi:hypothetical protein